MTFETNLFFLCRLGPKSLLSSSLHYISKYLVFSYLLYSASACDADRFDCGNGECIDKEFVCDGVEDCGNNKDEEGCKGKYLFLFAVEYNQPFRLLGDH